MAVYTVLGPTGAPMQPPYASFAGKTQTAAPTGPTHWLFDGYIEVPLFTTIVIAAIKLTAMISLVPIRL